MRKTLMLSIVLFACTPPPSPTEVRSHIADDLGYVLHQSKDAADGSTANLPSRAAFGMLTQTLDSTGTAARMLAPISRVVASKTAPSADGSTSFDPDAITKQLNDELFTDANYRGDGVYQVPASLVCSQTTYDSSGTPTTTIDADCAQRLAEIDLRVRVEHDGDGLHFWLEVDKNHDEPLGLFLSHTELAITIDLDEATDAMIALSQLYGQQAPNADLSGRITASLQVLGEAHARVALDFDRALAIRFADQGASLDSPAAYRFTSAAAHVIAIELDGHATKASFDLGLGETTMHAPADVDPATDLILAGATVSATFQGNTLAMTNLSLGDKTTTVSVGGQPAIAIDLNPDDGRKLAATVTVDPATNLATLAVAPRLDLRSSIDHAVLGDSRPTYDVTRVQLDGSLRSTAVTDQVEVVAGSFAITTSPAQYGFAANSGQCVQSKTAYDATTYDSYTQYSVGACL